MMTTQRCTLPDEPIISMPDDDDDDDDDDDKDRADDDCRAIKGLSIVRIRLLVLYPPSLATSIQ